MFGRERESRFALDSDSHAIQIIDACLSHRANIGDAVFIIREFTNPGYVIDSTDFKITFIDKEGNNIATTTTGLNYKTSPGSINVSDWEATNYLVNSRSSILFSLQPEHPSRTEDVLIRISLPAEDFDSLPDPCLIDDYNQLINVSSINCSTNKETNSFELTSVLKEPYEFEEFAMIELGIENIKMPTSTRPTGKFTIEFFDKIENEYRLVDTVEFYDKIRSLAGELDSVNIIPRANITYNEDTFEFEFKTSHKILQGGSIEIVLPEELTLLDQAICEPFEVSTSPTMSLDAECSFEPDNNLIRVTDAFQESDQEDLETALYLAVKGIFTQRSSKPTSAFKFRTMDSDGYDIDQHGTYALSPMLAKRNVEKAVATGEFGEVGELTTYEFIIESPVPLYDGDVILLTAPFQGISRELAYSFKECAGSPNQDYLTADLHCVRKGIDSLEITVSLNTEPIVLNSIPANTPFGFTIKDLSNTQSTKPSEPFYIRIEDYDRYLVTTITPDNALLPGFVLSAQTPSNLLYAEVESTVTIPLEETIIQFTI